MSVIKKLMPYITIDRNVFVFWIGKVLGIEKSVAVTDGDGSQMLRGRMGTETMSDGDGYNFCGNGWGWLDFPRHSGARRRHTAVLLRLFAPFDPMRL